jgi:multiple sugar transport system substrate-binding protein
MGYKSYNEMKADFLPGALDGLTFEGQTYGVPMQSNAFSLFINKKHFLEVGLDPIKDAPKTWDDVARVGKRLAKSEGGRMVREGFDFGYMLPTWIMYQVQPIIQQHGGDILDVAGKAAVGSDQAVKALQMMQDLLYVHRVGDPTITASSGANPNEDFVQGKLSMWLTGPWAIQTFKPNPDVFQHYAVVPHPPLDLAKPITSVYGFNLCVNAAASAEKRAVAWDFIRFLTADPIEWMNKLAFPIPRKKWYEAAEAQQFPYLKVFIDDIAYGRPLVKSARFDEIIAAIERAVQRIMLNKGNVKEALNLAAVEMNKAIGR